MKVEEPSDFLIPDDARLRRKVSEEIRRGYFLLMRCQFHYAIALLSKQKCHLAETIDGSAVSNQHQPNQTPPQVL